MLTLLRHAFRKDAGIRGSSAYSRSTSTGFTDHPRLIPYAEEAEEMKEAMSAA